MAIEKITLGGGCFWCLDGLFRRVRGVQSVVSGYTGGATENPSYEQVCTGSTGHAEVVQVTFDSEQITLTDIINLFFHMHDPTTLNRQGADVGTQYRSAIFYHSPEQRSVIEQEKERLVASGLWSDPVVTTLEPCPEFYAAEPYHQKFYDNNPANGYCQVVIEPKLQKFLHNHSEHLL